MTNELFQVKVKGDTCKTCLHRDSWHCDPRVIQYCSIRRSRRTNNGKKIKCKIPACELYEKDRIMGSYNRCENCGEIYDYEDLCPNCGNSGIIEEINEKDVVLRIKVVNRNLAARLKEMLKQHGDLTT